MGKGRRRKGVFKLNDTKKDDIKYVYSYLRRQNLKRGQKLTDTMMLKQTAEMLRVHISSVFRVLNKEEPPMPKKSCKIKVKVDSSETG